MQIEDNMINQESRNKIAGLRALRDGKVICKLSNLSQESDGEEVTIGGYVDSIRDHGGLLFVDIRSMSDRFQTVYNPQINKDCFDIAKTLGNEYVVEITGPVTKRSQDTINDKIPNGDLEITASKIKIISKAKTLPFDIHADNLAGEEIRLKYRYIDLRRPKLQELLIKKHKLFLETRNYFSNNNFIEVQTPILANPSPEGARDYLVPSRLHEGKFYALPQAPQQFKQLLMVGGFNKYFQIAPCFRDEDPRSDRHPGDFYQIDAEMAWHTDDDVYDYCWKYLQDVVSKHTTKSLYPTMDKMSYDTAINCYGSDKPDMRIYQDSSQDIIKNLGWVNVKNVFKDSGFAVFEKLVDNNKAKVVALNIKNGVDKFTRSDLDKVQDIGRSFGLPGIAYIQYYNEEIKSPLLKFFTDKDAVLESLAQSIDTQSGDLVLFLAGENANIIQKAQNAMRKHIANKLDLLKKDELRFVWINDMPFFEEDDKTGKVDFGHNPFGMFRAEEGKTEMQTLDDAIANNKLTDLRAIQYDIACNGYEILSGGQRNPNPELLTKAFTTVGYTKEEVKARFGHMLEAYQYGAPYHAGFAFGADRMFMVLNDEDNIREVIAFPKNGQGIDTMMQSPISIDPKTLKELHIATLTE